MRWRLLLPTLGLLLFALEVYDSNRDWKVHASPSRYTWWASIRLDSHPLNRDPRFCDINAENSARWNGPLKIVDPGYLANASFFSGLPAFLASMVITAALSRLGISQIWTFMVSAPILLFAWYYFLGWLLDRWRGRSPRVTVNT
ncbi:MAG TPA: hypothetical protein VGR55_08600 [Candidatus Acidoferrum sp.]|nr:hypothetical protein [Candidatus Acidoferrum sp.]